VSPRSVRYPQNRRLFILATVGVCYPPSWLVEMVWTRFLIHHSSARRRGRRWPQGKDQILCNHKEFNMKNACRTVALVFFMSLASFGSVCFAQSDLGTIFGFLSRTRLEQLFPTPRSQSETIPPSSARRLRMNRAIMQLQNLPPGLYTDRRGSRFSRSSNPRTISSTRADI